MVSTYWTLVKQPSRGVLRKRCSENLQQVYIRTPMSKYNFNKIRSMAHAKRACEEKVDEAKNTEGVIMPTDFSFSGLVWNEKQNDWNY